MPYARSGHARSHAVHARISDDSAISSPDAFFTPVGISPSDGGSGFFGRDGGGRGMERPGGMTKLRS